MLTQGCVRRSVVLLVAIYSATLHAQSYDPYQSVPLSVDTPVNNIMPGHTSAVPLDNHDWLQPTPEPQATVVPSKSACSSPGCSSNGLSNLLGFKGCSAGGSGSDGGCSGGGGGCSGGDGGCSGGCSGSGCEEDSPWVAGGWISWGSTYNDQGNRTSDGNAPYGFNNFADGPVLNQAWIYAAREAQTGGDLDWGVRSDFLFGSDGPDTTAFGDGGWDSSWTTGGEYGFAMPQLYGELAWQNWHVIAGHFFTIIGYEVVQAPDNFFYSHALTQYYNEPFTHTGFLADYTVGDHLTLYGGWTAGWDSGWGNRNGGSSFLGGASVTLSDALSVFYALTAGDPGDAAGGRDNNFMNSLVLDWVINDAFEYVMQWDYQTMEVGGADEQAYAVNQYLFYTINDCLSWGNRFEWFRDDDGGRIGNGPGDYYGATTGLNWRPNPDSNLVVRPEVRFDWFDGAGQPFDNNTKRSLVTGAMNAVWVF